MPRRGAPQGQGPESAGAAWRVLPTTEKAENNFSSCGLEHFSQTIPVRSEITIFSNRDPHSRHRNSKIGIVFPPEQAPRTNISKAGSRIKEP
jgi:hypothetical protein